MFSCVELSRVETRLLNIVFVLVEYLSFNRFQDLDMNPIAERRTTLVLQVTFGSIDGMMGNLRPLAFLFTKNRPFPGFEVYKTIFSFVKSAELPE